jgi:hypothetical protein
MKKIKLLIIFIFCVKFFFSQFPKFSIGGLSRAMSNTSYLDANDSINEDVSQEFNIIFDMAINGQLNKNVNLYSELRLGSSLDVFDTSASYINLRRLLIFGEFNRHLSFEIGDVDLIMTPFTLWNSTEEGNVNESELFRAYRQIQHYENYNNEHFWRRQGVQFFGKMDFGKNDTISYKFFGSREKSSNEFSIPNVFLYGEQFYYKNKQFQFGLNHIDLFTNNSGILIDSNLHNHVISSSIVFDFKKLEISAESGISKLSNYNSNNNWIEGEFIYLTANYLINKSLSFDLNFRSVSDDFSSPGSQTKRINYNLPPNLFQNEINQQSQRLINSGDIINDISLFRSNSIYNRTIDYQLDTYNPLFGLAEPYGLSTPNRRGLTTKLNFNDSSKKVKLFTNFSLLYDLTAEGVNAKRRYNNYSVGGVIKLDQFFDFKKQINLYGGLSYSTINRNHPDEINVEDVDFNNSLVDLALDLEVIQDLFLLVGLKKLNASGIDYLPVREDDFSITSYNLYSASISEQISAFGLKYTFSKKSSLMLNYQLIDRVDLQNNIYYSSNQIFVLIQITF